MTTFALYGRLIRETKFQQLGAVKTQVYFCPNYLKAFFCATWSIKYLQLHFWAKGSENDDLGVQSCSCLQTHFKALDDIDTWNCKVGQKLTQNDDFCPNYFKNIALATWSSRDSKLQLWAKPDVKWRFSLDSCQLPQKQSFCFLKPHLLKIALLIQKGVKMTIGPSNLRIVWKRSFTY